MEHEVTLLASHSPFGWRAKVTSGTHPHLFLLTFFCFVRFALTYMERLFPVFSNLAEWLVTTALLRELNTIPGTQKASFLFLKM